MPTPQEQLVVLFILPTLKYKYNSSLYSTNNKRQINLPKVLSSLASVAGRSLGSISGGGG